MAEPNTKPEANTQQNGVEPNGEQQGASAVLDDLESLAKGLAMVMPLAPYLFILFFLQNEWNLGGVVAIRDGVPGLYNHGTLIEPLTIDALRRHGAYESLVVSALWATVYLMQTITFATRLSLARDEDKTGVLSRAG